MIYNKRYQIALILFLVTIPYLNSFSCSFHFDDNYVILSDPLIRDMRNLPEIFSGAFERPLLRASFALNYAFNGLNVAGYHLFNLVLHLTVCLEIFYLAKLLEKMFARGQEKSFFPLLSALAFGMHPLFTGSVTYIASRSAAMATFFYLLSMIFVVLALERKDVNKRRRDVFLLFSVAAFAAGFLVKEIIVTLPAMLVIYLFIGYDGRPGTFAKKYMLPAAVFFFVLGGYFLARYAAFEHIIPSDEARIYEGVLSPYHYFLTELKVIVFYYLKWLLVPVGGPFADPDIPAETTFLSASVLLSAGFISSVIFLALKYRKRFPIPSFGVLWFFITLLPTSSIFPLGDVAVERHVYLPGAGFSLIAGSILEGLRKKIPAKAALAVFTLLFVFLGYATAERNKVWLSEVTLWEDAAGKSPQKVRVLNNRAFAYMIEGELDIAARYYAELLAQFPEYPYGHSNLGSIYEAQGRIAEAIQEYQEAVRLRPDNPLLRAKLGAAYDKAGSRLAAIEQLNAALAGDPSNPQIMALLALVLSKNGDFGRAAALAGKSLELDPQNRLAAEIMRQIHERQK